VLKYLFGAIFIGLAWALVLVFHEVMPLWPAIAVTAVVVLGLGLLALYRALASRKAAAGIEKGLGEQAGRHSQGARPDMEADIAAMTAEFQKAVRTLKASKVGRSGRDALGILPWYVMIGPPGSGKTTAIRNSGIKFPYGRTSAVRGVGGTRNCAWWMANDAILLDTAGRWSVEDDDREEWFAFLDLIKSTRPKKPMNGVMIAVPASDLLKDVDEIAELSKTLRERLDEVVERLDIVLPVYIVVTKCDLVSGFLETFGDLKDKDRGQILGFTLPLVPEHADHIEAVAQHFDDLGEVLERNAVHRIGEERRVDARAKILNFPQQFDQLRQGLIDLVSVLFDQSVYHDVPIMRGVYFTSGTQEGGPIDRVMAAMAEAFGVRPRLASAPTAKPKSYFVRDFFQEVVFPDGAVAVRSSRVLRRERLVRWALAGAALAASAAFLFLPISSYLENEQLISQGRGLVERLARARGDRGAAGALQSPPLESVAATAGRFASFAAKGPDIALRFGLYPGERLLQPLRVAVERLTIRPLLESDALWLGTFAQGRAEADASGAQTGLMLHLLLTQRKEDDEPAPESDAWRDKWVQVIAQQAGARWAALIGDGGTTAGRRSLEDLVRFYALRTATAGELVERKTSLVSGVRTALIGSAAGDPLADFMRNPDLPADVRLIDIVGGAVTTFQPKEADPRTGKPAQGPTVAGIFTPAGWKVVKARMERLVADRQHDENGWVLGSGRKRVQIDPDLVRTTYFRRYIEAWKDFLVALSVQEPSDIGEVRSLLKSLMTDKSLDAIWRNTNKYLVFSDDSLLGAALAKEKAGLGQRLSDAKKKLMGDDDAPAPGQAAPAKAAGAEPTTPEDVKREFASFLSFGLTEPSGLKTYGQILAEISAAVGEQGSPDPKAFSEAIKKQKTLLQNLIANYNDRGWESQFLGRILTPPLRGAEVAVSGATGESANRKWCDGIVVVYDQLFGGKYPFTSSPGAHEAKSADLDKFFAPKGGALWQYFNETLQTDIDHTPNTTVFHLKDQAGVKYKPNLLAFLKRAQELTDLLYGRDPSKLGVAAAMRIRPSPPYARIIFESGGKRISFINATERWEDISWPSRGALFRLMQKSSADGRSIEGQIGYADGEWALFQLLERGKLTPMSEGDEYLAGAWPDGIGATIHADVKPVGLLRTFRGLDVPRGVVSGAAGCGR
jgi:type VI secretion system protein ImpL